MKIHYQVTIVIYTRLHQLIQYTVSCRVLTADMRQTVCTMNRPICQHLSVFHLYRELIW